jgi:hypothetical protein
MAQFLSLVGMWQKREWAYRERTEAMSLSFVEQVDVPDGDAMPLAASAHGS